ncbi:excalibur calcium-binding domain-containing protein [Actinoplanes sp. NPDC023714]|uniref:excalibur calcium-binding domain-containing protein n=1 Tax=Actinoplanes sp. NPDC023714 TaxID=3154322 RepID=UPI0033D3CB3F
MFRLTPPWQGILDRRREEEARRRAEEERRRAEEERRRAEEARRKAEEQRRQRWALVFLGVAGVIAAIGITIGAITEDDTDGQQVVAGASTPAAAQQRAVAAAKTPKTAATTPKTAATAKPAATKPPTKAATVEDEEDESDGGTDPRFATCAKANAAGYGPYMRGVDVEYAWYRDRDKDGQVCE